MITVINNCNVYEISDIIFKLSSHLKHIYNEEYEGKILPLDICEEEVFKIFYDWFKVVTLNFGLYTPNKEEIFNIKFFKDLDIKTLIKVFNFAWNCKIQLLCNTVAYVIAKKGVFIYQYDEQFYIFGDININVKTTIFKNYYINPYLPKYILTYMSEEIFEKQPDNIRKLRGELYFPDIEDTYNEDKDFLKVYVDFEKEYNIDDLYLLYTVWLNSSYNNNNKFYKCLHESDSIICIDLEEVFEKYIADDISVSEHISNNIMSYRLFLEFLTKIKKATKNYKELKEYYDDFINYIKQL